MTKIYKPPHSPRFMGIKAKIPFMDTKYFAKSVGKTELEKLEILVNRAVENIDKSPNSDTLKYWMKPILKKYLTPEFIEYRYELNKEIESINESNYSNIRYNLELSHDEFLIKMKQLTEKWQNNNFEVVEPYLKDLKAISNYIKSISIFDAARVKEKDSKKNNSNNKVC